MFYGRMFVFQILKHEDPLDTSIIKMLVFIAFLVKNPYFY